MNPNECAHANLVPFSVSGNSYDCPFEDIVSWYCPDCGLEMPEDGYEASEDEEIPF